MKGNKFFKNTMYMNSENWISDEGKVRELFLAVKYGPHDKAIQLIKEMKNLAVKDHHGSTLLHEIYRFSPEKQLEIAQYLVEHGVPLNARTDEGNSPLHHATFSNKAVPLFKYLVSKGADIHQVNDEGRTILHFAVMLDAYELVKELVECHNFFVNIKDNNGNTPLHDASYADALRVAQYLVDRGASIQVTNNRGQTPLNYLLSLGGRESVSNFLANLSKNMFCEEKVGRLRFV